MSVNRFIRIVSRPTYNPAPPGVLGTKIQFNLIFFVDSEGLFDDSDEKLTSLFDCLCLNLVAAVEGNPVFKRDIKKTQQYCCSIRVRRLTLLYVDRLDGIGRIRFLLNEKVLFVRLFSKEDRC